MIGALRRLVGRHGPPAEPAEQAGPAGGVAVYVWRPRGAARNFGDETGPLVVGRLAERLTGRTPVLRTLEKGAPKLLTVGSILHKAAEGDCIWGAGVNGKTALGNLAGRPRLDIRAVRGPLTAELLERAGYAVPTAQGDPALLFPSLYGAEIDAEEEAVSGPPTARAHRPRRSAAGIRPAGIIPQTTAQASRTSATQPPARGQAPEAHSGPIRDLLRRISEPENLGPDCSRRSLRASPRNH